jgi:hypothetical protein
MNFNMSKFLIDENIKTAIGDQVDGFSFRRKKSRKNRLLECQINLEKKEQIKISTILDLIKDQRDHK